MADVFECYQSRGSEGMEILGRESIPMKNPGGIDSFFESGMENTETWNSGKFILIPEHPSIGSKGKEIPELGSIQMKNPGGKSSFVSVNETTEIGTRQMKNPVENEFSESDLQDPFKDLIDFAPNRAPEGKEIPELGSIQMKNPGGKSSFALVLKTTEIGTRQMKNPGENEFLESDLQDPFEDLIDFFSNRASEGMENIEIGSTHMKNHSECSLFPGLGMDKTEIGSPQMKNWGMLGNTAYTVADVSFTNHCSDKDVLGWVRRNGLNFFAGDFWRKYIYDSCMERKTCIWPGCTYSWNGKSSRIMWVGVHGKDSICVVTRDRDADMMRLDHGVRYRGTKYFRRAVISDIEDLADPNTYSVLRQRCDKGIQKPFGVVSVIPHTDEVDKESGHKGSNDEFVEKLKFLAYELSYTQPPIGSDEKEIKEFKEMKQKLASTITEAIFQASSKAEHDEKKAIKFLQEKMRSNMAFTVNETIQTAISAFQHLFQTKFKANEIQVSVIDPDYFITPEEANNHKDPYVKELDINDIEGHLAVISGGSRSGGSRSGGSGSGGSSDADAIMRFLKQIQCSSGGGSIIHL